MFIGLQRFALHGSYPVLDVLDRRHVVLYDDCVEVSILPLIKALVPHILEVFDGASHFLRFF